MGHDGHWLTSVHLQYIVFPEGTQELRLVSSSPTPHCPQTTHSILTPILAHGLLTFLPSELPPSGCTNTSVVHPSALFTNIQLDHFSSTLTCLLFVLLHPLHKYPTGWLHLPFMCLLFILLHALHKHPTR